MKVYDLFCGLGGFSEGFLAEGYECHGFDIEAHDYGTGGYPGTLILRDVRSIHGSELADATCIVASPPCQAYSYRAMPWRKAKALPPPDNTLFNECFRIQREASAAAGRHIPMVVENVRGAQKWVGRAMAHYGSFYLWGDVGMVGKRVIAGDPRFGLGAAPARIHKVPGFRFDGSGGSFQTASVEATKNGGNGSWFAIGSPGQTTLKGNPDGRKVPEYSDPRRNGGKRVHLTAPYENAAGLRGNPDGRKHDGSGWDEKGSLASHNRLVPNTGVGVKEGGDWWDKECRKTGMARFGSKSNSRKAASAMIAKIPLPLALHIARAFKPMENVQ
jgi:hypothetical protein